MLKVVTTTGNVVVGRVEWGTWAANSPQPRELFLETVYAQNEDGSWRPVDGSEGMFFHESTIESIEFFRTQEPPDARETLVPQRSAGEGATKAGNTK